MYDGRMTLKTFALVNIALLIVATVFAVPQKALACSCMAPPTTVEGIRDYVNKNDLVFTGVMTGSDFGGNASFRVTKMYKGPQVGTVSVQVAPMRINRSPNPDGTVSVASNSCDWLPQMATEYLIYAKSDPNIPVGYSTGLCSGNHVLPLSYEEQVALEGSGSTGPITPAPSPTPALACPFISRTLMRGVSGSEVQDLQRYFTAIGVLGSSSMTGYFGPLTEGAVQEWQASRNIVSSGSPATTGWGVVGPRTRAALARCER